MVRRLIVAGLVSAGLLAAACGGSDAESDDSGPGNGGGQSASEATASGGGSDATPSSPSDGGAAGGSGTGSVDIGDLPPPGEARLQVGDQEFIFLASEAVSERIFSCEIAENMVTINFQSDENDLTVQGSNLTGEWIMNVGARPRDGEGGYSSIGANFATEGQALVYVGEFSFTPDADRASFQNLGEGRVAVSCP